MTPERQERVADVYQWFYAGPSRWLWFCLAVLTLAGVAWATRFEYVRHDRASFHRVNRWTGDIVFCNFNECAPAKPSTPGG